MRLVLPVLPLRLFPLWLVPAVLIPAQTNNQPDAFLLTPKDASDLAIRMVQLMESTAVAVPALIGASAPVKQNADGALADMQRMPQNPGLTYQFITDVRAYLALSDSFPKPAPFPAAAIQQFAELRTDLERMQQHFQAILQNLNQVTQKRDSDPNSSLAIRA